MKPKIILPFLLIIVTINFCKAQFASADALSSSGKYQKSVFIEGGGNGFGVSGNFDMRLNPDRNDGLGVRAGAGIIATYITLPLGLNNIVGKKRVVLKAVLGSLRYTTLI